METQNQKAVVLIVEDELALREMSSLALEMAGYSVCEAAAAQAALDILESGQIVDLMFTDVQMPGQFNGLELARIVSVRWPLVKLIVTSGSFLIKAGDLPSDGRFLAKPYTISQLLQFVNDLIVLDLSKG